MTITEPPATKIATSVLAIATSLIAPDPDQPRRAFDPDYIAALGASIAAEGLLQPITVRPDPKRKGRYIIVAGECRWRGHCHAGLQTVRCIVSDKCEEEVSRFRTQVMENMARAGMSLKEESEAAKRLTDMGDTDEKIATAIGLSISRMRNIRRMAMLSPIVWSLLATGVINPAIAEWVMGNVKADHEIEPLLIRMNGKSRGQSAIIAEAFVAEKNQDTFMLACEEAGVTAKKDDLAKQMTVLLMHAATVIAKLSAKDQAVFGRQMGATIAESAPKTKEIARSAQFIIKAMTTVCSSNEL